MMQLKEATDDEIQTYEKDLDLKTSQRYENALSTEEALESNIIYLQKRYRESLIKI